MKRAIFSSLLLLLALPAGAAEGDQSYISYDDGQTVVRQGYDGRDIEARVNLPVFAGDEIVSARRGRTEIRLSDGNVVALDQDSAVRLVSIANVYEAAAEEQTAGQTVVELVYGSAIVHRPGSETDPLRLDTSTASYVALTDGIFSVDSDARGRDRLSVLSGAVEIRTRERSYRLRAGETALVGPEGIYDIQAAGSGENAFERWYLRRADRYLGGTGRYLDSNLAYAESDLSSHGDWVYVGEYGWVWRPYASSGWRPYYHGRWHYGPRGHLIWASYEPWGWVPYHYGRWAHHPFYGWIWMPGSVYSHAWVYWNYGASWIGWVPVGWYDCYRPYRPWFWDAGRPRFGVGFFGRVNLANADLSGWTFVGSGAIVSNRVDRAALTIDAVRGRMARDSNAIFSSSSVRFSREDIRDPAAAVGRIARQGLGGGTGKEGSGSLADLTPFFRRDPELSPAVRSQLDRSNLSEAVRRLTVPTPDEGRRATHSPVVTDRETGQIIRRAIDPTAPVAPGRSDSIERSGIDRSTGPAAGTDRGTGAGRIERGGTSPTAPVTRSPATTPPAPPATPRRNVGAGAERSGGAIERREPVEARPAPAAPEERQIRSREDWRGEVARPAPAEPQPRRELQWRDGSSSPSPRGTDSSASSGDSAPIPRRVIDRIGGARLVPRRDSEPSATERREPSPRTRISSPSPSRDSSVARPAPSGRSSVRSAPSGRSSVRAPSPSPSRSRGSVSRPSSSPSRSSAASRPSSTRSSSSSSPKGGSGRKSSNIKRD
ncbi:MAG TPA: DUF6600 domain-containing protein [Thermoanaerobaculia bacterium]|nr:DUF6600 domain-containing protein [Thermoanaerobaculia bacterium]